MPKQLSKELIAQIREKVKQGDSKASVATFFGLNRSTIQKYTRDIPSKMFLSNQKKEMIREMVKETGSKIGTSRTLVVPYETVRRVTSDIPVEKGGYMLGRKNLLFLKELMEKGYVLLSGQASVRYRLLKTYFPMIQRVRFKNTSIAFLPDKKEEAVKAFLENMHWKVIGYHELRRLTRLFGVNLDSSEKHRVLGKPKKIVRSITQTDILDF